MLITKMKSFLGQGKSDVKGGTVQFYDTDTEDRFKKNYNELIKSQIDIDVEYSFNSQGFRCNELTDRPNVTFLGCSTTVGTGVKKEKTFSNLISTHLNLEENNLAICGSSNDAAFRLASYWLKKLNPSLVVWLVTYDNRIEIIDHKNIKQLKATDTAKDRLFKVWLANDANRMLQKNKNIFAVSHICHNLKIPLITVDIQDIEFIDYARDLSHPGEGAHKKVTDIVLSRINTQKDKNDN